MMVARERTNLRDIQRRIHRDLKPDWIWRRNIWRQTLSMATSGAIFLQMTMNFQPGISQGSGNGLMDHIVTSPHSCTWRVFPEIRETSASGEQSVHKGWNYYGGWNDDWKSTWVRRRLPALAQEVCSHEWQAIQLHFCSRKDNDPVQNEFESQKSAGE